LNDNTFKQIHIALTIPLKCKNGKHWHTLNYLSRWKLVLQFCSTRPEIGIYSTKSRESSLFCPRRFNFCMFVLCRKPAVLCSAIPSDRQIGHSHSPSARCVGLKPVTSWSQHWTPPKTHYEGDFLTTKGNSQKYNIQPIDFGKGNRLNYYLKKLVNNRFDIVDA
jgi:hypothetical protein